MRQLTLPGISLRPKTSDIKAFVQQKLVGFELRQAMRKQKRERRNERRRIWR